MNPAPQSSLRRRRGWVALAGMVALLAVAVPVAWASHQFTDVPDGHQFHTEIGAIADAGVTSGKTCVPPGTPPTFCPNEPVVRQAMAAFMHRGFGRAGHGVGGAPLTDTPTDLAIIVIDVGGVPGGTQFVQLYGAYGADVDDGTGCPCSSEFFILQDGVGDISQPHYVTNDQTGGRHIQSAAVTTAVAVPAGTTQTFRLQGVRPSFNTAGSVIAGGEMTAHVVPFGNTGGDTLGSEPVGTGLQTPFSPRR
jgi:hypothetical protein